MMDSSSLLNTHKAQEEKHWVPIHAALGKDYADYALASVAKLYKGARVDISQAHDLDRLMVNAVPGAIIPTGYGANLAIYLAFNPEYTQVDAESGASGDFRPDWKYGHSSAYYIHTDNKGEILAVTAPKGHAPSSFELTPGALDLLQKHTGPMIPFPFSTDQSVASGFYVSAGQVERGSAKALEKVRGTLES